jgi:hypothetical protein
VHANQKNLTHPNSARSSDRVLQQCLILEEYSAKIHNVQGEKNIVVNDLSRLPTEELFIMGGNGVSL